MGRVDSVLRTHGGSDPFRKEALRVARLLTKLPVTYKRGQFFKDVISLRFVFTQEKQLHFL